MRANSKQREPQLQEWWLKSKVYETLSRQNEGEAFILHDGPPYANGDLHIGHALNKVQDTVSGILQDVMLSRSCRMLACDCVHRWRPGCESCLHVTERHLAITASA